MIAWQNPQGIPATDYTCGYCGREVSANFGWIARNPEHGQFGSPTRDVELLLLAVCPRCGNPTYLRGPLQVPAVAFGDQVGYLPDDVATLYQEARGSVSHGNYTAGVMVGRKLLMNVAVAKGAAENQSFATYVTFLLDHHVITPDMEPWVDQIRQVGNVANHEIPPVTKEQAEDLITFLGMLLKVVYEYPGRHQAILAARAAQGDDTSPSS